ncbi:hypothetical protein ELG69_16310 [Rhizobium leguminosarum]|uniref:undecaprenyl diphosphate synthase family protein n=1 Tax=Rhizobium leguminosarum TaxID=384 RepID=UPI00102F89A7|nr:undecaprenyl diphosphate synthase family protein [Rhizobium leguminosarum]TBG85553.1 hypothetical protein ELG69_16310 [Rhizobium leguminosarum]
MYIAIILGARRLKIFYIPDGHRRFAAKFGLSLEESYRTGIRVLEDEVIPPLLSDARVDELLVFCLSRQNLVRRDEAELQSFIRVGTEMLSELADRCARHWAVSTLGSVLHDNLTLGQTNDKSLKFLIGSGIDDADQLPEVDLFFRSGGELRLSGAPRCLIGNDTQFYTLEKLHPELVRGDIIALMDKYRARYVRSTDTVNVNSERSDSNEHGNS